MVEKFRGSSQIPLAAEGIRQAQDVGMKLARRGGLDELHTSSLNRTVHTAKLISQFTHTPIVDITDRLHPWHIGALEGQDTTPQAHEFMQQLITERPDEGIPGRGPLSTADGESFNSFKQRTLEKFQELLARSASHPQLRIGAVTHYRDKKLMDAWLRKGASPSGEIDPDEMNRHDLANTPASVDRVWVDPNAGPQMTAVDLDGPGDLPGGVYLIRHGKTEWNGDQS